MNKFHIIALFIGLASAQQLPQFGDSSSVAERLAKFKSAAEARAQSESEEDSEDDSSDDDSDKGLGRWKKLALKKNLTEEQLDAIKEMKDVWASMTDEEKAEKKAEWKAKRADKKEAWASLTEEEKAEKKAEFKAKRAEKKRGKFAKKAIKNKIKDKLVSNFSEEELAAMKEAWAEKTSEEKEAAKKKQEEMLIEI